MVSCDKCRFVLSASEKYLYVFDDGEWKSYHQACWLIKHKSLIRATRRELTEQVWRTCVKMIPLMRTYTLEDESDMENFLELIQTCADELLKI